MHVDVAVEGDEFIVGAGDQLAAARSRVGAVDRGEVQCNVSAVGGTVVVDVRGMRHARSRRATCVQREGDEALVRVHFLNGHRSGGAARKHGAAVAVGGKFVGLLPGILHEIQPGAFPAVGVGPDVTLGNDRA